MVVLGVEKIRLIRTDADIHAAVRAWCGEWENDWGKTVCKVPGDPVRAEAEYGHISQWDTLRVTSMDGLFRYMCEFNEDISGWDVRNVTGMWAMFYGASSFNQDLSAWSVRNVCIMRGMFHKATRFNQDLSEWDVENGTDMLGMFDGTRLKTRPSWYIAFLKK